MCCPSASPRPRRTRAGAALRERKPGGREARCARPKAKRAGTRCAAEGAGRPFPPPLPGRGRLAALRRWPYRRFQSADKPINTKIALIQKKIRGDFCFRRPLASMEAPMDANFASRRRSCPGPSGSSNPVAGSRARLASRRWRPFLTIKARQNALATNFAAGKFPCLRAFPTPCPSADFVNILRLYRRPFFFLAARDGAGIRRGRGRSLSKAAAGKRGRRSERVPSLHAHRLAKTERMALRRPLCFFASPRVRRRPWPGLPDAFAIKGTLPPPEPVIAPCPYMNNSRLTAITAMPPMRP